MRNDQENNQDLGNGNTEQAHHIIMESGDSVQDNYTANREDKDPIYEHTSHNDQIKNEFDINMNKNNNTIDNEVQTLSQIKKTNASSITEHRKYTKKQNMDDIHWSPVLMAESDLQMIMTINKSALKNKKESTPHPTIEEASEHLTANGVEHKAIQSKELAKGGFRFYFSFNDTESRQNAHFILTNFYNDTYGINIGELKGGEGDRYRILSSTLVKIRHIVETKGNLDQNAFNILYQVSLTLGLGTNSHSRISMIQEHLKKLRLAFPEKTLSACEKKEKKIGNKKK